MATPTTVSITRGDRQRIPSSDESEWIELTDPTTDEPLDLTDRSVSFAMTTEAVDGLRVSLTNEPVVHEDPTTGKVAITLAPEDTAVPINGARTALYGQFSVSGGENDPTTPSPAVKVIVSQSRAEIEESAGLLATYSFDAMAKDGVVDADGTRLANLADPVNDQDAITQSALDAALNNFNTDTSGLAPLDGGGTEQLINYAGIETSSLTVAGEDITGSTTTESAGGTDTISHIYNDGPQAALSAAQNPNAIYESSEDKTFIVFRGVDADPYATYYDHSSGHFASETQIGTNDLGNTDEHGMPSMCIDDSGHLYCFFGGHDDKAYVTIAKSDNPYDTASWSTLGDLPGLGLESGTYPSPLVYNGTIYALYRSGGAGGQNSAHDSTYPAHEFATIISSSDGGSTWTDEGPVIDLTGHPDEYTDAYVYDFDVLNGEIRLTWAIAHGGSHNEQRAHAFHAVYDPANGEMRDLAGNSYSVPITWSEISGSSVQVYQGQETSGPRHAINGDGETFVCFNAYNSSADQIEWRAGRWDSASGSWTVSQIDNALTNDSYNAGYPRTTDDGHIQFYGITGDGSSANLTSSGNLGAERGGHVERFTRQDDGSWNREMIIAKDQATDAAVGWNPPSAVRNGTDEFPALVSEWSRDKTQLGMRLFAIGSVSQSPSELFVSDPDLIPSIPEDTPETFEEGITVSGDGSTTEFYVGHDHPMTPAYTSLSPTSQAAANGYWISGKSPSQLRINFDTAPTSGTTVEWDGVLSGAGQFDGDVLDDFEWASSDAITDHYSGDVGGFSTTQSPVNEGSYAITGDGGESANFVFDTSQSISRPLTIGFYFYILPDTRTHGGVLAFTGGNTPSTWSGYRVATISEPNTGSNGYWATSVELWEDGGRTSELAATGYGHPGWQTGEWVLCVAEFGTDDITIYTVADGGIVNGAQTTTDATFSSGNMGLYAFRDVTLDNIQSL